LSLEEATSCRESCTSPEQPDRAEAIALVTAMRVGRQSGELDDFGICLVRGERAASGDTPVVTAFENYALFMWGCQGNSQ
jgi:hypothetical protein